MYLNTITFLLFTRCRWASILLIFKVGYSNHVPWNLSQTCFLFVLLINMLLHNRLSKSAGIKNEKAIVLRKNINHKLINYRYEKLIFKRFVINNQPSLLKYWTNTVNGCVCSGQTIAKRTAQVNKYIQETFFYNLFIITIKLSLHGNGTWLNTFLATMKHPLTVFFSFCMLSIFSVFNSCSKLMKQITVIFSK